jgi:hypothetical protein
MIMAVWTHIYTAGAMHKNGWLLPDRFASLVTSTQLIITDIGYS